jgi:hypothetical protein
MGAKTGHGAKDWLLRGIANVTKHGLPSVSRQAEE